MNNFYRNMGLAAAVITLIGLNYAFAQSQTSSFQADRISIAYAAPKLRAILEGVLRFGQAHSLGDLWHALGRVQEGERGLPPDLHDTIGWFCQVTGLA